MSQQLQWCVDLPRESYARELAVANVDYQLGPPAPLPPDPDDAEARFIEPVTLIATVTLAMLASRIVHHWLVKDGRGVLIDMTLSPPHVTTLAGVPAGFVVLKHADGRSDTVAAGKIDDAGLAALIGKALAAGR